MPDPTTLPAWVDSVATAYLKWGLGIVILMIVATLVVSARHEVRKKRKK